MSEQEKISRREFIKKFSKKALGVGALLEGSNLLKGGSKENSKEVDKSRNIFKDITEKYKTFDLNNRKEILGQLDLYEKNRKVLENLTGDERAEYLHQLSFTQTRLLLSDFGFKETNEIMLEPERSKKEAKKIEATTKKLREMSRNINYSLDIREDVGSDDINRTFRLKLEIRDMIIRINASTQEAINKKEKVFSDIYQYLKDKDKRIEVEKDEQYFRPYFSFQVKLPNGEQFPLSIIYNPLEADDIVVRSASPVGSVGIVPSEKIIIEEIRELITKRK